MPDREMPEAEEKAKKWFICDPGINKECRKRSCVLYGGPCELTSRAEYALKDEEGKPIQVCPRQRLKEKMKARKEGKGPFFNMITFN